MWSILLMRAHATTWVVDPSGAGDALTITDGVALAADGDTVEIRAGTYYESDVYSSSENLTIRGDGAETTILDGSLSPGMTALGLHATTALEGLTIQNHLGGLTLFATTSTDAVATIDVAAAIIAESTLSFLGLGFPPDIPTWGRILYDGRDYMDLAVHWAMFPGLAIFLTVLTINFIGDGLRDALDPRRVL